MKSRKSTLSVGPRQSKSFELVLSFFGRFRPSLTQGSDAFIMGNRVTRDGVNGPTLPRGLGLLCRRPMTASEASSSGQPDREGAVQWILFHCLA